MSKTGKQKTSKKNMASVGSIIKVRIEQPKTKLKTATNGLFSLFSIFSFLIALPMTAVWYILINFGGLDKFNSILYPFLFSFLTSFIICLFIAGIKLLAQLSHQANATITTFLKDKKLVRFLFAFPVVVLLFLTSFFLFKNDSTPTVYAGWWNDNWSYRKAIVINSQYVTADLTDFPALISLTDSNVGTHVQEDGDDIIFISSEGKKLSHEIESFATSTGVLVAWVKIPSLSSTDDTTLYMYYGNAGASSSAEPAEVWDDNYVGVWHLPDDENASTTDSTQYSNNGIAIATASTTAAGKIDGAFQFDGDSDYVSVIDNNSLDISGHLTISAWIKPNVTDDDDGIMQKSDGTTGDFAYEMGIYSDTLNFGMNDDYNKVSIAFSDTTNWSYVVGVYDGSYARLYVNGDEKNNTIYSIDPKITDYDFQIGQWDGTRNRPFQGIIDEVQVSNTNRSADWIQTSFTNQASTTLFLSVQAEETGPGPVGYWSFDTGYGTTARDESANNNDGTITGAVWQDESMCVSGKCLYFDGDDYVDVSSPIIENSATFTITAWFRTTSNDNNALYTEAKNGALSPVLELYTNTDGYLLFYYRDDLSTYVTLDSNPTIVNDDQWHFGAIVQSSKSDRELFLNGVSVDSDTTSIGDLNNSDNAYIGVIDSFSGKNNYLDGFIDEVKIYPYARSADQIRQDYAAGLAGMKTEHGAAVTFGSESDKWLTDGLVGYWKMDESATTSGAVDASGNGNDGTYYDNASTTAGKFGNGGVFDGSGDYMDAASPAIFDDMSALSITAWIYPRSFGETGKGRVVNKSSGTGPSNGWALWVDTTSNRLRFKVDGTNPDLIVSIANAITLDAWNYVSLTWDGSDTAINTKLYINGFEGSYSEQTDGSGDRNTDEAQNLIIGNNADSDRSFDGQIDEVRVYNRALSPREVKKLYQWAPGPVAWWKFDELTGTTTYDSVASSSTEGGNDGYFVNDATSPTWTRGKYGSALDFDGSDYVNMGDVLDFERTDPFSIALWLKTTNSGDVSIMGKMNSDPTYEGYELYIASNKLRTNIRNEDSINAILVEGNTVINDGSWHHIALSYDGSSQAAGVTLYVDGQDDTGSIDYDNLTDSIVNSYPLNLGARNENPSFDGLIDDVRIYNYALNQKQIINVMSARGGSAFGGNAPLNSEMAVLHLKFDEGYGGTAYDSSPQGNNGTLYALTGNATSSMWSLDGRFGKAMEFDGTDDYVHVGDQDNLLNITTAHSISAWVYAETLAEDKAIFSGEASDSSTPANNAGYWLGLKSSGLISFFIGVGLSNVGEPPSQFTISNSSLSTGQWYHLVGTRDGSTGKIYINGVLDVTNNNFSTSNISYDGGAYETDKYGIGRYKRLGYDGGYFDGLIDEVKIYNFALTQEEIYLDYNQGKAAIMGGLSTATTTAGIHVPSNAASRQYCVPGSNDYCAAPVLELKFDELTGTTTYDTSGNGNDGVFVSAASSPAWTPLGKVGSALQFDGGDDYVYSSGPDADYPITVSVWVKTTNSGNRASIVGRGNASSDYFLFEHSGNIRAWFYVDGSNYVYDGSNGLDGGQINDGGWHNVVFTVDSGGGELYVDGKSKDTMAWFGTPGPITSSNSINISSHYLGEKFDGLIDHVRIYNYARTPAQIAWDYNRGQPIAHWTFDECSGSTIYDQSRRCKDTADCNNGALNLAPAGVTAIGTCASSTSSFWYNGRDGKRNAAGSFDGGDDYVDFSSDTFLPRGANTAITIAFWFKPGSSDLSSIIEHWDTSDNSDKAWDVMYNGLFTFRINDYGTNNEESCVNNTTIPLGQWTFAVLTQSDNDNEMKIYINSELDKICASNYQLGPDNATSHFHIGVKKNGASWQNNYDGLIDEVKIFNYALTEEQIRTEYNGGAVRFGN